MEAIMKNLVKIVTLLSLLGSLNLIGMGATSTGSVSATSAATNSVSAAAANTGVSAHVANEEHHRGGYNHSSRNRTYGKDRFNRLNTPRNNTMMRQGMTPGNPAL